jgi:hypothetical protein
MASNWYKERHPNATYNEFKPWLAGSEGVTYYKVQSAIAIVIALI